MPSRDSVLAFGALAMAGAFHFIRYHLSARPGRDIHERETEGRALGSSCSGRAPEDAGEQEVLDSRAARRQAEEPPAGLAASDAVRGRHQLDEYCCRAWGICVLRRVPGLFLLAILRDFRRRLGHRPGGAYFTLLVFAYRVSSGRREAKIEQQLLRELRREKRQRVPSGRGKRRPEPQPPRDLTPRAGGSLWL